MLTRRHLIKAGTVGGAALLVPAALTLRRPAQAAPVPGGTLDPATVPKYVLPLFVPPAMPGGRSVAGVDFHEIGVRQFNQRVLPPGMPTTPVFGYGRIADSSTFHYPAYTIEARVDRVTRVRWANQLMTSNGNYRPHLLPVDPTLHWANPPGGTAGRDMRPEFTTTPGPYRGPVPVVTHLHGAHVVEESDGYPEAWYLPPARNIPRGYARVGSFHDRFKAEAVGHTGVDWPTGSAVFDYRNDQRATTLWFHSHELGITRLNIYAGLTGMYLLRGGSADLPAGVLPGPAPQPGDPPGVRYHELPLILQDRSFNADGSLFFPSSRGFFGDTPPNGPFLPTTDVSPIWNPEFFGNTMVVNGNTWPVLAVEPRRYRFRVLNACNARTLMVKIATDPLAARPAKAALPIWVIGTDGGFLPAPVPLESARLGVSERLDVIVDFTGLPVGSTLYLINEGPDEPFGGGTVGVDFQPADPGTTGQVLKFVVTAAASADTSVPPAQLRLPSITRLGGASVIRRLSLNELTSGTFADAPTEGMLGTVNADGTAAPLPWMAPVTENPRRGATEIWEFRNFTGDAHPIHVHQVQFQVLDRRPFGGTDNPTQIGPPRPAESWESGFKDTVVSLPSEITRIKARFDIAGRYVWHCHIIDHEDNEMMRPYQVGS
ncbi:MAG: bilirubin oxidase [Actinobacteria bacterium 13_2_20CM_2_71_6]|nr:MAG: bilirubin oxidase [Actinobacteria bacterium 13_2_20CM_2_71_6]